MIVKDFYEHLSWLEDAADFEIRCGNGNRGWHNEVGMCYTGRKLIEELGLSNEDISVFKEKVEELFYKTEFQSSKYKMYKGSSKKLKIAMSTSKWCFFCILFIY